MTDRRLGLGIVLCHACMVTLALGSNQLAVFLTTIARDLGGTHSIPNEQMGRLSAMSCTAWVISMLVMGPATDRFGAKPFAILGNLCIAAGLIGCSLAPSYWPLAGAIILLAIGGGMLDMVASAVVSAAYQVGRSKALNRLHAFFCIGSAFSLAVGILWLLCHWNWRYAYMALAPIPLLTAIGFFWASTPRLTHEEQRTPVGSMLSHGIFWIAVLAMFMSGGSEMGIAVWLPAHVERSLGTAPWLGAVGLFGLMTFMSIGRLTGGWLAGRFAAEKILTTAAITTTALLLLGGLAPAGWVALISCMLVGLTTSVMWPTTMGLAGDRFPSGGATFIGLLGAVGNSSGIVIPWAMGIVADQTSLRVAVATTAIAPFCLLLVAQALGRRQRA